LRTGLDWLASDGSQMPHVIDINEIKPGDVLLCFSAVMSEELRTATGSGYSHAAICLENSIAAESAIRGVRKTPIAVLLEEYEHIAIFREPHNWDFERVGLLRQFVEWAITAKVTFNFDGFRDFTTSQAEHQRTLMQNIAMFHEEKLPSPAAERDAYFCSEFIAAAFVAVRIVGPGAALVFDPRVISPGSLKDPTYGLFLGYLIPYSGYQVPADDEFIMTTPFHKIWPE
jgi:hypothetical protein